MPFVLGASAVGIEPVGDGSFADLELLIPNPDNQDRATSIGHHLDEMSPAAAVQLRIELNNWLATSGSEEGVNFATGNHVVTGGEATANEVEIDTGIDTDAPFGTLIVSIKRSGTQVAGGTITDNSDGTFTITESGGLNITAADTIDWFVRV